MKQFLDDNFLLESRTAEKLFHNYASNMPVIDFHNHLPPEAIAFNSNFSSITGLWLGGDHYKWRAMRTLGIEEKYITGDANDWEKFEKWAEVVPYTIRNPLYHWTHLELQRYFKIYKLLKPDTAREIYNACNNLLPENEFSVLSLLNKMKVEICCTTDDPTDSLEFHKLINMQSGIRVYPTWRPDKALNADNPVIFNRWINKLEEVSGIAITNYNQLLEALQLRHDYFAENGCRLSDHGLQEFYAHSYTLGEVNKIFELARKGKLLNQSELIKYKSSLLFDLAVMDHQKIWTQQFHYGVLRNNNSKMFEKIGPDTGFDSIGDFKTAQSMQQFFDRLSASECLTKTIIYNINPSDNEVIATMTGNFNDGGMKGKMQFGSAWWFLDQKDGMEKQLNTLSSLGLLSCFIGMTTDSRSFLSFPRHEYFRRILCNLLGNEIENGLLPGDTDLIGGIVQDICYNNAKKFFKFKD